MIHLRQKPLLGVPVNWSHPLARGLVSCWLMNEGVGNKIYDLSGNKNTGSFYGDTKWVPGKYGPCLSFDGDGDYVNLGNSNIFDITSNTISMWVKTGTSVNQRYVLDSFVGDSPYPFALRLLANGKMRYLIFDGTNFPLIDSSVTVVDNNWHHIVGKRDTSTDKIYIYIDSVERGNTTDTTTLSTFNNNNLYLGVKGDFSASTYFNGTIDNVMIFNRALIAQEIAWLYREPFAMFDRPSIGLLYVPPAGGQTILDYERGVRGVNRGVMVGVS